LEAAHGAQYAIAENDFYPFPPVFDEKDPGTSPSASQEGRQSERRRADPVHWG
jgi:hypothetical protein